MYSDMMEISSMNLVLKVFKSLHLRNVGVISHACCPKRVVPYMELFCHVKIRLSVEIK